MDTQPSEIVRCLKQADPVALKLIDLIANLSHVTSSDEDVNAYWIELAALKEKMFGSRYYVEAMEIVRDFERRSDDSVNDQDVQWVEESMARLNLATFAYSIWKDENLELSSDQFFRTVVPSHFQFSQDCINAYIDMRTRILVKKILEKCENSAEDDDVEINPEMEAAFPKTSEAYGLKDDHEIAKHVVRLARERFDTIDQLTDVPSLEEGWTKESLHAQWKPVLRQLLDSLRPTTVAPQTPKYPSDDELNDNFHQVAAENEDGHLSTNDSDYDDAVEAVEVNDVFEEEDDNDVFADTYQEILPAGEPRQPEKRSIMDEQPDADMLTEHDFERDSQEEEQEDEEFIDELNSDSDESYAEVVDLSNLPADDRNEIEEIKDEVKTPYSQRKNKQVILDNTTQESDRTLASSSRNQKEASIDAVLDGIEEHVTRTTATTATTTVTRSEGSEKRGSQDDKNEDAEQKRELKKARRVLPSSTPAPLVPSGSEPQKWRRTQRNRRWTDTELEALEEGLAHFQQPLWRSIKYRHQEILSERTNVQLKDKARNEIERLRRANEPLGVYAYVLQPAIKTESD
ncbi:uncharacterized protein BYT42DRAFT_548352 [Radiomyces spectabilis]|uniref:uncharacterized protein n=1 Tax=Radiomyces spectabilis TaxID=64574 RepID=UPI00221FB29E|nr:uncharacterized protein BYT42DRAFT_548352 [Radiomyces spectabilis]KAI8371495.1 hypothetical protein BYT42DRAFT_548352 [Radiomyces spectabilis]